MCDVGSAPLPNSGQDWKPEIGIRNTWVELGPGRKATGISTVCAINNLQIIIP